VPSIHCAADGCRNRARGGQTHCWLHIEEIRQILAPVHPDIAARVDSGAPIDPDEARLRTENAQLHQGIRQAQGDSTTAGDQTGAEHRDLFGVIGAVRDMADEIASITKRVAAVEALTSSARTDVETLTSNIETIRTAVEGLKSKEADCKAKLAHLDSELAEIRATHEYLKSRGA
jgi:chromosome segregation ATPase